MKVTNRILSLLLVVIMVINMIPMHAHAAEADASLTAALEKAKNYTNGITVNNSSNDPYTVVSKFGTHFTWDNEKRESSKSYLFDWSYYNGVVFEGIEYLYEVTGDTIYKDYVVEYMSTLIASNGTWATCANNSSKQCAGYNSTHGADCYKTASLLLDAYQMTGDSRYLTMAATLYTDLDNAAKSYSLKNAGNNYRHTWSSDPSPDLWLDGLYMILPFRAEYAKYIGDQEELDLIVSRMQWVSDNMYNSSKGLFYHAADSASSNSGTYWLRSIGWYAAAIVDIMDSMEGSNLEAMKVQLKKLVDGMKACQNSSNGMWLNNMNASQSSSNPYETSGTALTCYAVMKAVNNGWLDESYADMAILAFKGICNEKLNGSTLTDICFKGAPGSSNSTFYDNEGKGVGPFIMFYAEVLEYANKADEEPEATEPTEPEPTEPEPTEPEPTEPEPTDPSEPEEEDVTYSGTGYLEGDAVYTLDNDGVNSGEKYLIVYNGRALQNNNGVDKNPTVTISNNTITLADDSTYAWTITKQSGSNYYVENNGSYLNLTASGNDPIGNMATVNISGTSTYKFRNTSSSGAYLRYSSSQLFCAGTSSSNSSMSLYRRTSAGNGSEVVFTLSPSANVVKTGSTLALNGTVTVDGQSVNLSSCTINWSSSNTGAATVSNGTVTGVASGDATITATLSVVNGTALKNNIVLNVPITVQGHDYQAVVTAPTCTENGYTTYTCSICGDSYITDEVSALGHDYESVTTDATCAENGSIVYTCHCGDTYTEVIEATGHKYTAVITAPTCTAKGYTTYTCSVCFHSYIADEVNALGHDYESVVTAPTCTENGRVVYTCHCGNTYTEVIEATGHNYTAVVTAPTCTKDGYTTYTCAVCENSYVAEFVDALGHNYEVVTVEPTCTANGSITTTCTVCGESNVELIEATGHNYTAVITAPTCIDEGYTTYTCHACNHSYTDNYVSALGHDVVSVVTDPTCTTKGYTVHTCTECNETYIDSYVDALGHKYESVTTEPTCTEKGSIVYTCHCGDSYAEVIEATGHTYEAVTVEPTCTDNGSTTYTCHCGDSYAEVIEATGHTYDAVVTDPTCTENGYTTYTCHCGDSYVADKVAALGHTYESVTTGATCTEGGSVVYTCHCGDSYTEVVSATGHKYEAIVTAPTCEEAGYTTYTCHCGESYIGDEVDALGHDYEAIVTAPTCTENGYTTYTCHCGESYIGDEVNALGHSYETVITAPTCTKNGYTTYTCHCGDSYVADQVAALGHTYEAVTAEPTCTESGSVIYTCHCKDTYTEVLPALGHDYEAVVTDPTCTENGYTTYTCKACTDSYVDNETAAAGHNYNCVESEDMKVYTCENCGDSYTETFSWTLMTSYKLDTDGIDVGEDFKYIIVGSSNDYALSLSNGTVGSTAVKINGQTLTTDQADILEFYFKNNSSAENGTYLITRDGTNSIYHMSGNMYYGSDNKGYWHIGSAANGAYQIYDYDNTNWYLNYGYVWAGTSANRFAVSSTARTVRLFQKDELYVRLLGELNQTVTDADEATASSIAAQLTIQISENGSDITKTVAVTESMLTWDKLFDGTTAEVYTATVTYQGYDIGVVTITVTSKHSYVTEVIAPTCTEDGYTVRTCSECGVRYVNNFTDALGHNYICTIINNDYHYECENCGDSYILCYDVHSAAFSVNSIKKNAKVTLVIQTTDLVESITVRNSAGKKESITVSSVVTADGVKTWTVTFRITTTGTKTFTVYGYGANGETGDTAKATVKVTRY